MRLKHSKRAGVTVVESAVVYPIVFLLVVGLIVGSWGVFRYQELASLARRAARWASVHGTQYAFDTKNPAATPQDIYNNAIAPYAIGFDPSLLTYSVTWNTDNAPFHTINVNGSVTPFRNIVTVTVNYQWLPEAFLGQIQLSSTSNMPMSY
jgi:Flp pilus assembly protein TadG